MSALELRSGAERCESDIPASTPAKPLSPMSPSAPTIKPPEAVLKLAALPSPTTVPRLP